MEKLLEAKVIKTILLLLINLLVTLIFVFIGFKMIIKNGQVEQPISLVTGTIEIGTTIKSFADNVKEIPEEGLDEITEESMLEDNKQTPSNSSIIDNSSVNSSAISSGVQGTQYGTVTIPNSSSNTVGNGQGNNIGSNTVTPIKPSENTSYTPEPNYASLIGLNARISEGASFNPLEDLKLKATDRDGTDITNQIKVISNNVDINQGGHYSVTVSVKLQDNVEITQTFSVEVIATPLKVHVSDIALAEQEIEANQKVNLTFTVNSSKETIVPLIANINGRDYPINKVSENQFSVELNGIVESKVETISLNSIQMSDGSLITVNQKVTLTVLKQLPTIQKLNQIVDSYTGEMSIDLEILDSDSALQKNKPLVVVLYDENGQEVAKEEFNVEGISNHHFTIPMNGIYYLEVFGYINRNYTNSYEWMSIYREELLIEEIGASSVIDEEVMTDEALEINKMRMVMYEEVLPIMNEEELIVQEAAQESSIYSTRSNQVITTSGEQKTSLLIISGKIANDEGRFSEQITVTLPTAVSFSVDKDGHFISAENMEIQNDSAVSVNVSVSSFKDPSENIGTGITIVSKDNLTGNESNYDRSFVSLALTASNSNGDSTVELLHGMNEKELVTVAAQNNTQLKLTGNAGTGSTNVTYKNNSSDFTTNGATEKFELTFKISR